MKAYKHVDKKHVGVNLVKTVEITGVKHVRVKHFLVKISGPLHGINIRDMQKMAAI